MDPFKKAALGLALVFTMSAAYGNLPFFHPANPLSPTHPIRQHHNDDHAGEKKTQRPIPGWLLAVPFVFLGVVMIGEAARRQRSNRQKTQPPKLS